MSPSLAGESFRARTADVLDDPGTVTVLSRICDENGGRLTFEASGQALGPYFGTFEEQGTIETAQPTGVEGPGVSISTTFSIDSALGDVEGTKSTFLPGEGLGQCYEDRVGDFFEDFFYGNAIVIYEATITSATGTFTDRGLASATLLYSKIDEDTAVPPPFPGSRNAVFEEDFLMSLPLSADDCKQGGFADFLLFGTAIFKNQGDCVSFIETGGRNPPATDLP